MKNKIILLIFAMVMVVCLLASCGGGSGERNIIISVSFTGNGCFAVLIFNLKNTVILLDFIDAHQAESAVFFGIFVDLKQFLHIINSSCGTAAEFISCAVNSVCYAGKSRTLILFADNKIFCNAVIIAKKTD